MKRVQQFLGGNVNIGKVRVAHQVADLTMKTPQGKMQLEIDTTTRYPDSQRLVMKTSMGEITMVVTPAASFSVALMGARDLPPSQRNTMLRDLKTDIFTVLRNVEQPGYTFAVEGTEKTGDIDAKIVTITCLDGETVKWTIDPVTGRLLRTRQASERGTQVTDYSDWKTFGALNLPTTYVIMVNGEKAANGTVRSFELNPSVDPRVWERPSQ